MNKEFKITLSDWTKSNIKSLELIHQQANDNLKYTLAVSDKISSLAFVILAILIPVVTFTLTLLFDDKAGCIDTKNSRNLMIALEPEAASLCCRRLSIANYASSEGIKFLPGMQYMVLDCGGSLVFG